MPVLYDFAIFLQDEFLQQYYEEKGVPQGNIVKLHFNDSTIARDQISQAQKGYRRLFDEE